MWDLSSLTRDSNCASYIGSAEPQPLDHWGGPHLSDLDDWEYLKKISYSWIRILEFCFFFFFALYIDIVINLQGIRSSYLELKQHHRNSLVVQWLGFPASTVGDTCSIPGQGTKILQALRWGEKNRTNKASRWILKKKNNITGWM